MNPKQSLSSHEIINLLAKLKTDTKPYPPELLSARRSGFIQKAAGMNIDLKGLRGKNLPKIHSTPLSTTMEIVLQSVLGAMFAVMVISGAIMYREEIIDFFTPDEQGVVSSEVTPQQLVFTPTSTSESIATTTISPSPHIQPTLTPTPYDLILESDNTPISIEPTSTRDKDNSGKHLGQTPTPPAKRETPQP